jgi:hypothetical protein
MEVSPMRLVIHADWIRMPHRPMWWRRLFCKHPDAVLKQTPQHWTVGGMAFDVTCPHCCMHLRWEIR